MAEKEVRKLAAVMFTDIEGYTAIVQKDEKASLDWVARHRLHLEECTREFNGRILQFYGDGSLSVYESAVDAVRCAIAMQQQYRTGQAVPVRIGIHLGDIVFARDTVFGDGVNIAARLQALGVAGSILISGRVQSELSNHRDITTKAIGKRKLKNVSAPVDIFAINHPDVAVPSLMNRMPELKSALRYLPFVALAALAWWFVESPLRDRWFGVDFKTESISVPVFGNLTGDPEYDHVGQMAAHWITKELSATPNARVVSYETASEMIQLAGVSLATAGGRSKYSVLTGATNIVEASFMPVGGNSDSLLMSGYIKNLASGAVVQSLRDVRCSSGQPMDCIREMSGQIKGYWASREDKLLTPPTYEAYKAYLAAKKAWRSADKTFVYEQLHKAIQLDPDFMDPYFLMLDYFFNERDHQAAADTIRSMQRRFSSPDTRQANLLQYHNADIQGKNADAYRYFLKEYHLDPKELFTNNTAMVMALMYRHDPREALIYFNAIANDSLHVDGCTYCAERFELAMWAALDLDNMALADMLSPKIERALYTRQSYGMLLMYHVWKKDTLKIDRIMMDALHDPALENNWQYLFYLTGRLFLLRGESGLAKHYAQKAIEAYETQGGRMAGRSYYLSGQWEKALPYYLEAHRKAPADARILAELGMVYARLQNTAKAIDLISQLADLRPPYDYGATEYFQGRIQALLGNTDDALRLLETAVAKGQKYDLWVTFDHDPDLMTLWQQDRYINLWKE